MHGRHKTVAECIERMPFIDKVFIYSTDEEARSFKHKTFLPWRNIETIRYRTNGTWQFERFSKSTSMRSFF